MRGGIGWVASIRGLASLSATIAGLAGAGFPIITTQPRDAAVNPGEAARFRAIATGADAVQWQKDGEDIPGATSWMLVIAEVQAVDAGLYTLTAANGAGRVTSRPARLFVTPPLSIEPAALLAWEANGHRYSVLSGDDVGGPWTPIKVPAFQVGNQVRLAVSTGGAAAFFKLTPDTVPPNLVGFPDPARFEEAIQEFEAMDEQGPPPEGAIVCIGSSSMRLWKDRLAVDLHPLTVVPRGFGGSTMYDALHFVDRVVLAYRPRAVLLYEGDNDIALGIEPERIRKTFDALVTRVQGLLPEVRIYVLAIKPSIARWSLWPDMREANRLLDEACILDGRLTYIDIATPMLQASGTPRPDIFLSDNLHMNALGYDIWAQTVGPLLLKGEGDYESAP